MYAVLPKITMSDRRVFLMTTNIVPDKINNINHVFWFKHILLSIGTKKKLLLALCMGSCEIIKLIMSMSSSITGLLWNDHHWCGGRVV